LRLKTLAGTAASVAAIVASALPAAAAGTVTATPTTITTDGQAVQVTWEGFTGPTFLTQCSKSIGDPSFNPDFDCDNDTNGGVVLGPIAGSATINVFVGDKPLFGWACFTSAEGLEVRNPCYLRMSQVGTGNLDGDFEVALNYSAPQPVIPEVPYSVLLPMGAIAAIGAGIFLNRRRLAA
jgi:hypothetical protein